MSNNNARYVVAPTVTGAQAPCACVLHGAGSVAKFDVLNLCFYNRIPCVATRLPAVLGQMKVREVLEPLLAAGACTSTIASERALCRQLCADSSCGSDQGPCAVEEEG